MKVLCCFSILKKDNSAIPSILDQLSIAVSTLSNHVSKEVKDVMGRMR